jgi:CheY-like chemotaxis protein/anti-sigma regulatory factor (Ser/Thr protein kinase)
VRAALETSAPGIDAARHQLEISLPSEELVVEADPVRLNQVLVNLLNNAARYTPDGGHIRIAVHRQGDDAVISVRDDGLGIPPDALGRIFEPFTLIDHPGREHRGLGIGLALVGQLVRIHGGKVEARSDGPGCGSEFVVRLPLSRHPVAAEADRSQAQPAARETYAQPILVVDDNRDAAESLAVLLRARGMKVETAHDGESALSLLPRVKPGAVLLDLGMPGMDGLEVARRMRSTPDGRTVLLIALTGWGQIEMRGNSRAAGFDHHCVKPVEIDDLESLLVGK